MEIVSQFLPFIILAAILYFIIIRPHQKDAKNREQMIASLKKGDKFVTFGGLIAVVHKVEETFISAKINDDTIVRIVKDGVARKYEDEA